MSGFFEEPRFFAFFDFLLTSSLVIPLCLRDFVVTPLPKQQLVGASAWGLLSGLTIAPGTAGS
jgi:hypothetical protein